MIPTAVISEVMITGFHFSLLSFFFLICDLILQSLSIHRHFKCMNARMFKLIYKPVK